MPMSEHRLVTQPEGRSSHMCTHNKSTEIAIKLGNDFDTSVNINSVNLKPTHLQLATSYNPNLNTDQVKTHAS